MPLKTGHAMLLEMSRIMSHDRVLSANSNAEFKILSCTSILNLTTSTLQNCASKVVLKCRNQCVH